MDRGDTRRPGWQGGQGMLTAVSAGLVAGVSAQLCWPAVPDIVLLGTGMVVLLVSALYATGWWRSCAAAVAGASFGMLIASIHGQAVLDARLPVADEASDFVIDGRVASIQQQADGSQLLQVVSESLPWGPQAGWLPGWRLRITCRDPVAALPGEHWRLHVRLKRPRAGQNPGVADFERYLLGERVVATGYLRDGDMTQRLREAGGWSAVRLALLAHALPLLGDGPGDIADSDAERFARAVLPALVLDERGLLSSTQWRVLADTGTAHLVAISGLHIALFWGALIWLAGVLLRRRPDSLRYRFAAVLPALVLAVSYAAIAGMPLPALRATVMLVVASAFLVFGGQVPAWRVLLASAAVVLLLDPLSVHASGFWLSFGAVGLLLLLNDTRRRAARVSAWPRWVGAMGLGLRMQVALSLLLAPLLVGLFGAASVSSVAANIPAIPLVNLFALPPGLIGFLLAPVAPGFADVLLDAATATLHGLWVLLVYVDGMPWFAPLQVYAAEALHVFLVMVLLPLLLFAGSLPVKLATVIGICLAWPVAAGVPTGAARVCVLDVGQGLAVLVRTARHAVLYDTGPAWGERDAGAGVVVPAARALGVGQLDVLVVSHDDMDHAGGAASVQRALQPVATRIGDLRSRERLAGTGKLCDRVERFAFDGVRFVLYPGAREGNDNDRSCVLHVDAGGRRLLVPGDSSRRRELSLLEEHGDALAAEVLIAGHHGSRTATSPTFLYRVAPRQVIFSVAHNNRFGHPHAEVTDMVRRQGAAAHATPQAGALCFVLSAEYLPTPQGWRGRERRFWRE